MASLTLNGKSRPVQKATLSCFLHTENGVRYDPALAFLDYELQVVVDEGSGEDGEPAPYFILSLKKLPTALPWQLAGHEFGPKDEIEAWYGNDAPSLDDNRIRFSPARSPKRLAVMWEATYEDWDSKERKKAIFHFQGDVDVPDVAMQVKKEEDVPRFLRMVFGKQAEKLKIAWGGWTDYGPDMPATRRRWRNLKLSRG